MSRLCALLSGSPCLSNRTAQHDVEHTMLSRTRGPVTTFGQSRSNFPAPLGGIVLKSLIVSLGAVAVRKIRTRARIMARMAPPTTRAGLIFLFSDIVLSYLSQQPEGHLS